jgi:preprotein translocase subunit SecG
MIKVLLVLHVFVTLALIGVVLIQRSEGGGLGLGGGQGMGNFMSGRGTANLLTRTTAILGTAFFALSLVLAILYKGAVSDNAASFLYAPQRSPAAVPGPAVPGMAPLPQTPADARPAPASPPATPPLVPVSPGPAVPMPAAPAPAMPASPVGSNKTN